MLKRHEIPINGNKLPVAIRRGDGQNY